MGFDSRFWDIVGLNYESLKTNAPEGHIAQVEVYVIGDPRPIPIGVVERHRERGWVMLQSLIEGRDDPDKLYPSDRYVFLKADQVSRVEIRFLPVEAPDEPKRQSIGFSVREAEEWAAT